MLHYAKMAEKLEQIDERVDLSMTGSDRQLTSQGPVIRSLMVIYDTSHISMGPLAFQTYLRTYTDLGSEQHGSISSSVARGAKSGGNGLSRSGVADGSSINHISLLGRNSTFLAPAVAARGKGTADSVGNGGILPQSLTHITRAHRQYLRIILDYWLEDTDPVLASSGRGHGSTDNSYQVREHNRDDLSKMLIASCALLTWTNFIHIYIILFINNEPDRWTSEEDEILAREALLQSTIPQAVLSTFLSSLRLRQCPYARK